MPSRSLNSLFLRHFARHFAKLPLRYVLVIPLVLQVVAVISLVGYFSFKNERQAIDKLAYQLLEEVSDRIQFQVDAYLQIPSRLNQTSQTVLQVDSLPDPTRLQQLFLKQLNTFPEIDYLAWGDRQGNYVDVTRDANGKLTTSVVDRSTDYQFYTYEFNQQGQQGKLLKNSGKYDPRTRPWYQAAIAAKGATWSPTYIWFDKTKTAIDAVLPIYGPDGEVLGVLDIPLTLSSISRFLQKLTVSRSGQSFIVEPSGKLIATSSSEKLLVVNQNGEPLRRQAADSQVPLIRASWDYLNRNLDQLGNLQQHTQLIFDWQGQRHYLHVGPIQNGQGIRWLMVVVVPDSDFMEHLQNNTQTTILLCMLAAIAVSAAGFLTARWIIEPIFSLNAAAKDIAAGNLDRTVAIQGAKELGELAQSFNQMAQQVQSSFAEMANLNEALSQSKSRLTQFLEAIPVGIAIHDAEGDVFYFNHKAQQLIGQAPIPGTSAVQLSRVYKVYKAGTDQLYPTEQLPIVRALQGENAVADDVEIYSDAGMIPVEVRATPIFDSQNQVVYAIAAFHDITERRQNELALKQAKNELTVQVALRTAELTETNQQLREANRRWRSLLDNVRLLVVGLDHTGKIEYVNPFFLELVGYTEAEVLGKDWFKTFLPKTQQATTQEVFHTVIEKNFYPHYHNAILSKSGEERMIAWNNTQLHDAQGQVIGTMSIGEDITQRQVIERMKDEFISVVSHELRTPLTAIQGSLGLLTAGIYDNQSDKAHRMLDIAKRQTERLVRLVNDILDLERLDSGKMALTKQNCDVAILIQYAIDGIRAIAEENQITVVVSPLDAQVWADSDAIVQALINLLSNAIKFSSPGTTIAIAAELVGVPNDLEESEHWHPIFSDSAASSSVPLVPPTHVCLKIKDQGRGIPADKLETIFGRFQQVDASDSREKGGTGLGLAICRSIIRQHGEHIWADSTPGEGSTFYFTLPIVQ